MFITKIDLPARSSCNECGIQRQQVHTTMRNRGLLIACSLKHIQRGPPGCAPNCT